MVVQRFPQLQKVAEKYRVTKRAVTKLAAKEAWQAANTNGDEVSVARVSGDQISTQFSATMIAFVFLDSTVRRRVAA